MKIVDIFIYPFDNAYASVFWYVQCMKNGIYFHALFFMKSNWRLPGNIYRDRVAYFPLSDEYTGDSINAFVLVLHVVVCINNTQVAFNVFTFLD